MIHIETRNETTPGPQLVMDCPACNGQGVVGLPAEVTETEYLYGAIPVSTSHWTTIICGQCNESFRVTASCEELACMTPGELSILVATQGMSFVSNITKFCIVMSLIFCLLPFFGLGCAIAGVIGTRKRRSRWRTAAKAGFVISAIINVVAVIAIATEKSR